MTMNDFQKFKEIRNLVEVSYPDVAEFKTVWRSVKNLLMYCNGYEFKKDQLEIFSQILDTGKPLCHLDFFKEPSEQDLILDVLDMPFVSFPFTHFLWKCDIGKNLYRFFYVNPDVFGAEDFSFKSKLALKDSCILLTSIDVKSLHPHDSIHFDNLNIPQAATFLVCCNVNKTGAKFGGVFEIQNVYPNTVTAIKIENSESEMQRRFCQKMNAAFPALNQMHSLAEKNTVWPWTELIPKTFF